jgi:hypothetical protein
MTSPVHPRTVAWAALWFLVVVTFTAGVGVISAASSAGEMPPLTTGVQAVVGELPDDPSSAPVADSARAG